MTTTLPKDGDGEAIQALRPSGAAHAISVTAASARNGAAFSSSTRVVALYATGAVYLKFGEGSVTASSSDHYFPSGVYHVFSLGWKVTRATHIAALRVSTDCTLYISELE